MLDLDVKIIIALIAVVVSFVGLIISKEQKTSEFRQNWINEIRSDIASLMGCLCHFSTSWMLLEDNDSKEVRKGFLSDNISIVNEMHVLLYRIELRLNPVKDKNLIEVLSNIECMVKSPSKLNDDTLFENLTEEFKSQSHSMLKTEWARVKDGEPIFKIAKYSFGFIVMAIIFRILYEVACL